MSNIPEAFVFIRFSGVPQEYKIYEIDFLGDSRTHLKFLQIIKYVSKINLYALVICRTSINLPFRISFSFVLKHNLALRRCLVDIFS